MAQSFLILAVYLVQMITSDLISSSNVPKTEFPIKFAYVNKVKDWSSA